MGIDFINAELWSTLEKRSKTAKRRYAAIAYVTSDTRVSFGRDDVVVVDASDHAVISGQTDRELLAKMLKNGVRVYSLARLHAKVIVFDRRYAVLGSANLSDRSSEALEEAGIITTDRGVVAEARDFVERLAAKGNPVDQIFVKHLMTLNVRKPMPPPSEPRSSIPRTWLVGTHEVDDNADEAKAISAGRAKANKLADNPDGVDWIRFARSKLRFVREASPGDRVIEIFRSKDGGIRVCGVIYILSRQPGDGWTRFWLNYGPATDRKWGAFQTLWRNSGGGKLGKFPCRELQPDLTKRLLARWA
jgi:hypothetical protein